MLPRTETVAMAAEHWLAQFEIALAKSDDVLLETLFHLDSHWRDILALTWQIRTISGSHSILGELKARAVRARPIAFRIDPDRTAPRLVTRAGAQTIEAIFSFETADGRGSGVLRLAPDSNGTTLKAWTLLTALNELKGFEEAVGRSRPKGQSYSRDFAAPTGSISEDLHPHMKTVIQTCWLLAADRPGCRSPHASNNYRSIR